jgi:hypothetical protein
MKIPVFLLALACLAPATGCFVSAQPAVVEAEYQPMYYEGQVVYYDDGGAPIYYVDEQVRYVPASYVHFGTLRTHYHNHAPAYRRWHESHPRARRDHRR